MDEFLDDLALFGVLGVVAYLVWRLMNGSNSLVQIGEPLAVEDRGIDVNASPVQVSDAFTAADTPVDVSATIAPLAPVTSVSKLQQWADAIFKFEGGKASSRNVRNNNPGNLTGAGYAGQVGNDGPYAVFDSPASGQAALVSDLQAKVQKYPDYSLLQIMTRYLGGNPIAPQVTNQGDPFQYAQYVADKLGVSVNTTLRQIFG